MADQWVLVKDRDRLAAGHLVTAVCKSGVIPGHTTTGEIIERRYGAVGTAFALTGTDGITPPGSFWEITARSFTWTVTLPDSLGTTESAPAFVGGSAIQRSTTAPPATWPTGSTVPTGGTTGQVLAKTSGVDYATDWVAQSGSGGGIPVAEKGAAGGVAELDSGGLVPSTQLPPSSGGSVVSVNGDTGPNVVLGAGDVGADPAGSATSAQSNAENYTDIGLGNLGDAATLDVGTVAGTVAAGDDARFGGGGQVDEVVGGKNVTVDSSDPVRPSVAVDSIPSGDVSYTAHNGWAAAGIQVPTTAQEGLDYTGDTFQLVIQFLAGLGDSAQLDVGTTTGTVAAGDDTRLSDARPPTLHAGTHATGGIDPVTPAAIGSVATAGTATTLWSGTQTAYDAIVTPDPGTVYVVTP